MHGKTSRLEPKTILEKVGKLSHENSQSLLSRISNPTPGNQIRLSSGSSSSGHDYIGPLDALVASRIRQALAAELAKQLRFPLFGILQVSIPDVPITADLFGKRGQFHGDAMVAGVEAADQVADRSSRTR